MDTINKPNHGSKDAKIQRMLFREGDPVDEEVQKYLPRDYHKYLRPNFHKGKKGRKITETKGLLSSE